jgi:hypothetical protein
MPALRGTRHPAAKVAQIANLGHAALADTLQAIQSKQ